MNKRSHLTLAATMLSFSGIASADFTNGPNPYNPGYGFDAPHEASWGGWTRGDVGTLFAEWDTFFDASYGTATDRTAAPDVGSANTGNAYFGWSAGTFAAGTGNLYSFAVPQNYNAIVTGSVGEGPVRAVLQFETWGTQMNYDSIALNGLAPTFTEQTYFQAAYPSSFGPVDLVQFLAYWDLPAELLTYNFSFGSDAHQSLAQVAVDIAAVPVPGAVWLMGSAILGLAGWRRRQYSTATAG
ncbi:MAG: VPLPA-CTERM sorting domain-containing protein [Gammaproteobacteria bacterium HGW-Gammaproteobacteria-10]|nr:MAG: VPLPA-CTERM sorting domain-containing protein [Gammaproteobacteria bacterium HGW-Gammaproteobacteria-10]